MYKFKAHGHANVLATHRNTIEITKHKELSLKGDCIIAVNSDFDLEKIKEEINNNSTIEITIKANSIDRKSTRLNSSHIPLSRMPSSA